MSASVQLLELYNEWKHLTECEGAAIMASDWTEVRRCQEKKQTLQPAIIEAGELIKKATSEDRDEFEPRLRKCVSELIELENHNSANLELRLQSARRDKNNLDRTSSRLKQIHKSYVPSQGSVWNQYS